MNVQQTQNQASEGSISQGRKPLRIQASPLSPREGDRGPSPKAPGSVDHISPEVAFMLADNCLKEILGSVGQIARETKVMDPRDVGMDLDKPAF